MATTRQDAKEPKKAFSDQVAEKLIKQLEEGTAPWQRPWANSSQDNLPMNPTSGNRYKGINVVHLLSEGRADPRWMTYKQAETIGAQVRKGEKGTTIQFWSFPDRGNSEESKQQNESEKSKTSVPFVRYSSVFNAEQIDGLEPLPPAKEKSWDSIERAERILLASGAQIDHAPQNRAAYYPKSDRILLPQKEQFSDAHLYYAVALHELGHWTGHESRLARDLSGAMGGERYAKEELRAEISSMLMGVEIGLGHDPSNHVAYVAHWIAELKKDPTVIFKAAADAEKIQSFLLQKELEYNNKIQLIANAPSNTPNTQYELSSSPITASFQTTPYQVGKSQSALAQAKEMPSPRLARSAGLKL